MGIARAQPILQDCAEISTAQDWSRTCFTKLYLGDIGRKTPPASFRACRHRLRSREEARMTDQGNTQAPVPARTPVKRRTGGKASFVALTLALALVVGLGGNMLSTAFGQGFAFRH